MHISGERHAVLEVGGAIWYSLFSSTKEEGWQKKVPCNSLLKYATHLHVFVSIIYFAVVSDSPAQIYAGGDKAPVGGMTLVTAHGFSAYIAEIFHTCGTLVLWH